MGLTKREAWILLGAAALLSPYAAFKLYKANDVAVSRFVDSQPFLRDLRDRYRFGAPPERKLTCEPIAPSPIPRFESPGVVVDNKLYVFGGFTPPGLTASSRCDVYDPDADDWTPIADLPAPLTHAAVVLIEREVWLLGGFVGDHPGPATDAVWIYDIDADAWRPGPALPAYRAAGAAAVVNGQLHYFGGSEADRRTDSTDHWRLDLGAPEAGWAVAASLPAPRNHLSAAVIGGHIYALGGQNNHDAWGRDLARADIYTPGEDAWSDGPWLKRPKAHFEPGTFFWEGRLCVAGGESNLLQALYDVDCLDAATAAWTRYPALPEPLRAPLVRSIGDAWYVGSGGVMPSGMKPTATFFRCEPPDAPL